MRRVGPERLSDAELLAVLLGTGRVGEPVELLAARLLRESDGLEGLWRMGEGGLARVRGLGPGKASRLLAGLELGRRLAASPACSRDPFRSAADVAARYAPAMAFLEDERFVAIALDARHRLLREIEVARGGRTGVEVDVGSAFRGLLREGAVAAIFLHNHPSGSPDPSQEDRMLTVRLVEAGRIVGVRVLDHVVLARGGHHSFAEEGVVAWDWPGARSSLEGLRRASGLVASGRGG